MKFFLSIFLLVLTLYANNPKIYAALGDIIYDNAPKIEKLKEFPQYKAFEEKIESYLKEVQAAKELGFAMEAGKSDEKRKYLKRLRELAKTNDFFVRSVRSIFENSMDHNMYDLFVKILDTGLVDVDRYKQEILKYYEKNKANINPYGILQDLIDESELKKAKKHSPEYYERLRKFKEQEKIRRLREKDRKRQEELQKKLEEELKKKKRQIEKEQIEELQKELE